MAEKKNILIVEDDADMQRIYKIVLGENYNLIIADNTKDAMKQLEKNKADLMLLDIILPRETGDTFLAHLKQMPKYKKLKVIAITVLGDITGQLKKIDPEATCIPKPFDKEKLLKEIEKRLKE